MKKILTAEILEKKAEEICKLCGLGAGMPADGCDHCRMHIHIEEEQGGHAYDVVLNGNKESIISITAS